MVVPLWCVALRSRLCLLKRASVKTLECKVHETMLGEKMLTCAVHVSMRLDSHHLLEFCQDAHKRLTLPSNKERSMLKRNCNLKNNDAMQCTNQLSGYVGYAQDLIPAPKLKHFGIQEK